MANKLQDINIKKYQDLSTPEKIKKQLPLDKEQKKTILEKRAQIQNILDKKDNRKIIITGPCSIHNINEALDYAKNLKEIQQKVEDKFLLIMRTYFEKPRTTLGWKGLIYDPDLNNSNKIQKGLKLARKLLLQLSEMKIPAGTEFLGPLIPQYIDDLISWAAIGARTSESQPHREMASGLSVPVGFKNDTSGNIKIAINSIKSAINPHSFLGTDKRGKISIVHTKGNKYCHLILRGGKKQGNYIPNYKKEDIERAEELLEKENLSKNIIIDCSHGNSKKDYKKQPYIFNNIIKQMQNNPNIKGLMLESNLNSGNQKLKQELVCGVSITDKCISWNQTQKLILNAYDKLK